MAEFKLTEEQQAVIESVGKGFTTKVVAVAGSGKTSTLRELALAHPELTFLYLVFNKAAALDAKNSFPDNVTVKTTAAMAFGSYRDLYGHRILGPRVPARRTAELLKMNKPLDLGDGILFRPASVASMAMETVDKFAYTSDFEITARHVPPLPLGLNAIQEDALRKEVAFWAARLWRETKMQNSEHRYTFDYAFKMWVHDEPSLYYDVIMLDEAQDSNEIVEYFIKQQSTQKVIVGDPAQQLYCQVLGSRVEKVESIGSGSAPTKTCSVPIEELSVGDRVVTWNNAKLYRNGQRISHITRFRYEGEVITATTSSGLSSTYTPKHHCIIRIDDNLADKHVVYLMRRGSQYRVGRTQMTYTSQQGFGFARRFSREKADGVWILSLHATAGGASTAELLTKSQYGIPTAHFEPTDTDVVDVRKFWENVGDNSVSGEKCLEAFGLLPEFPLWHAGLEGQRIGIRTAFPTAAANVLDGMLMLPLRNVERKRGESAPKQVWEQVTVSREYYADDVVSLEVDEHHNYFADGILTHNSWRGAINIMDRFDGEELPLSQSWRFGEAIAAEADKWLVHTGTRTRVKGNPAMDSRVTDVKLDVPHAILCRTNGGVMGNAVELMDRGLSVAVAGGASQIVSFAYAAGKLMRGQQVTDRELMAFKDWSELVAFTEEPGGRDLKPMVNMIKTHGVGGVLDICNAMVDEMKGDPDVVVSTAHKSKGREWHVVQVGDDFTPPPGVKDPFTGDSSPGPVIRTDAMLNYVTVTRARNLLSRGSLRYADDYDQVVLDPR